MSALGPPRAGGPGHFGRCARTPPSINLHLVERCVERAGRDVWAALERATPGIVRLLASAGVVGAECVVGFVHPLRVHVWLVTTTDAERDALGRNPFLAEVSSAIHASGFPVEHATIEGTVAQSQETVDRDYEGSWFYALR